MSLTCVNSHLGLASWHEDYRHSAYLYFGGLSKSLTEGDIIAVFSQYGEILDINLIRDKQSGESRGFGFLAYEDQRSTDLAVDNLNGIQLLGWTMRVNHVKEYRPPSAEAEEEKQVGFVDPYSQMERKRESERKEKELKHAEKKIAKKQKKDHEKKKKKQRKAVGRA
ncbi:RNA-binding motif protein, X-linked 2-like isoform X2 [Zophobas morio]|uniref:RNA-binding motif protein, X-linked 2-like isoform X2 n=1 Tax=Zophobas morio TaxID=2755281 RepID=UPI003082E23D